MGLESFAIGLAVMFGLIYLQIPIAIAMLATGFGGYALLVGVTPAVSTLVSAIDASVTSQSLAVVPLFLLMGSFASISGLATDLYRLSERMIGHRRGGLLHATIAGCAVFGAICGSSVATAATFGRVAMPEMATRGYALSLAGGTIAAAGTLGALIPPSVILVIYAIMTESFILDLFVAAVGPAVLAVALQMLTLAVVTARHPELAPPGDRYSRADRLEALIGAAPTLVFLLVIIGGMYGGVFTVNEAAAVGAILSIVFALLRGRLTWARFLGCLVEAGRNTGMIYLIIFGAEMMSYFVTVTGAPQAFTAFIEATGWPPLMIVAAFVLMYVVLGSVFDTIAAMLITLPFVLPVIESLGYDVVWWGIVTVAVVELGMITPPIGMNIFVLNAVAPQAGLPALFRGVLPFVLSDMVRIVLIVLFPVISLALLG
ncbi:TRAP transporter large permease (plasmid) [Tistrella bauzanensis]|jgi:tripartite ATP-independent transporter DctM subunit|uniref:TRAP transporter large permease protein n=1 Tax=Tistrella arctica TaxID=3133430 RepID=A0ABU9YL03_9PROT